MNSAKSIVIIGGTACGPKAAARARRVDPQARITLVEQDRALSVATCGFPYYVGGVIPDDRNLILRNPAYFKAVMDIDAVTGTRATGIDRQAHTVKLTDVDTGRTATMAYDKLVLATGAKSIKPKLPGVDLPGVFNFWKLNEAIAVHRWVAGLKEKKAVIVGAGLIGMEMAEALAVQGLEVTVVEALDRLLPAFLDYEMSAYVARHLPEGVRMLTGQRVSGFEAGTDGRVARVLTGQGAVEAGLVVLALGVKPNTELAAGAGLEIGASGGIAVNEYLQTSDPDIYAGGDCVENLNRLTGKKVLLPLGSTANKHGHVIGSNVAGLKETFPGILSTAVAKIFDCNAGRTGLGEAQAKELGYEVVTCLAPNNDHAGYYPGAKEIVIKLVADARTGKLLGGQVVGPGEVAKRVDVLATALTFGATVEDIANLDLGYAPPFNSASDPVHQAANVVRNKLNGQAKGINPAALKGKLENNDDFVLLDVRTGGEIASCRLDSPGCVRIPLSELRKRAGELPPGKPVVAYCRVSVRAYQAQKTLEGAGVDDVCFLDGSMVTWPYETQGDGPR
jgi:NADPH-dependent 2,4-dienoyl-CoA reductase/sulfur reductase-like enzyme/rhodanese-related sulfurtransferase